ncbi:hypothetical protein [Caballeronia sp. LZ035]|uniref:hypothetical protein n=1 Tax=Caballeronia sp. LZ035 TaxID=3038568 RepID=UPI00285C23EB|nr:hypothetical protein [Caballeronia sp. LZ035]MDR5761976.1 hypothetical protein [Caballeronia sp. LZ035]
MWEWDRRDECQPRRRGVGLPDASFDPFTETSPRASAWTLEHDPMPDQEDAPPGSDSSAPADGIFIRTVQDLVTRIALRFSRDVVQQCCAGETAFRDLQHIYTRREDWLTTLLQLGELLPTYVAYLPDAYRPQATSAAARLADALTLWRAADSLFRTTRSDARADASWLESVVAWLSLVDRCSAVLPDDMRDVSRSAIEWFKRGLGSYSAIDVLTRSLEPTLTNECLSMDDRLAQARHLIELQAARLPATSYAAMRAALQSSATLNACMRRMDDARAIFARAGNLTGLAQALITLPGDDAKGDVASFDRFTTFTTYCRALSETWLVVSNRLGGDGSADQPSAAGALHHRLAALVGFLGGPAGAPLRSHIPEPVLIVIDTSNVLMEQYQTGERLYGSLHEIHNSAGTLTARLGASASLIRNQSGRLLPEVARVPLMIIADLLDGLLQSWKGGDRSSAEARVRLIERAITQLERAARDPGLARVLPESARTGVSQALRSCQMLTGHLGALLSAHEHSSFTEFLQALLREDGPAAWLPQSLQPVLEWARMLSNVAEQFKPSNLPAYSADASVPEQLGWLAHAMQDPDRIDVLLKHVSPEMRSMLRTASVLLQKTWAGPQGDALPAQAQWLLSLVQSAEMRELLALGGVSQDEWMTGFVDTALAQELFKGFIEATRADSVLASVQVALVPLAKFKVIASASAAVVWHALGYAPLFGVERVLQGLLGQVTIEDSWQATVNKLLSGMAQDVAAVKGIIAEIHGIGMEIAARWPLMLSHADRTDVTRSNDKRLAERVGDLRRRIRERAETLGASPNLADLRGSLVALRETFGEIRKIARDVEVTDDIRLLIEATRDLCPLLLESFSETHFSHALTAIRRFPAQPESGDWQAMLSGFQGFEQTKPLYRAFIVVRLTWLTARLATADPTERAGRLDELTRELSHIADASFEGSDAIAGLRHILPLLPDLMAAREHIELPQAGSWLEWAARLADALAANEAPVIMRLRQSLEQQTEAWILGKLHQATDALLNRSPVQRETAPSRLAELMPLNRAWAVDVSVRDSVAEQGIHTIQGRRYIEERGGIYRVRYDREEGVLCVLSTNREHDRIAWHPLEFRGGHWWVKPRTRKLPGGAAIDAASTADPPSPTTAEPGTSHHQDESDVLTIHDFLVTDAGSKEATGMNWTRIAGAAGLAASLSLMLTLFFVWRAGRGADVPGSARRRSESPSVERFEDVPLSMELQPLPPDVSEIGESIDDSSGASKRNRYAVLLGALAAMMAAGSVWALVTPLDDASAEQDAAPGDDMPDRPDLLASEYLCGIESPSGLSHQLVIDAPIDLRPTHATHSEAGATLDATEAEAVEAGTQRLRRSVTATAASPEIWPMPGDSAVDAQLESAVANMFSAADAYAPEVEYFPQVEDKLYSNKAGTQKLLFANGRFWSCHKFDDFPPITGAENQDAVESTVSGKKGSAKRDAILSGGGKQLYIAFDGRNWKLKPGANAGVNTTSKPAPAALAKEVIAAIGRWSDQSAYPYVRGVGVEARLYADAQGNRLICLDRQFWRCVMFHPGLIEVMGIREARPDTVYLAWSAEASRWNLAQVASPSPLPVHIYTDELQRAMLEEAAPVEPPERLHRVDTYPGLYSTSIHPPRLKSEELYLKLDANFYRCTEKPLVGCKNTQRGYFIKAVSLVPKKPATPLVHAAWDEGLGQWQRIHFDDRTRCTPEFGADDLGLYGQFARANTAASADLLRQLSDLDDTVALNNLDVAQPPVPGGIYQSDRKLYMHLEEKFWPFVMLTPVLGILFTGKKKEQSRTLVCFKGAWVPLDAGVAMQNIYQLLQGSRMSELLEWSNTLLTRAGPMTWSQMLIGLDDLATDSLRDNVKIPDSEAFRMALLRKSLVWFLQRLTPPDKQWPPAIATSTSLSNDLMQQVGVELGRNEPVNEPDITFAVSVCDTTDQQIQKKLDELTTKITATEVELKNAEYYVLVEKRAKPDPEACADGPKAEPLLLVVLKEIYQLAADMNANAEWWAGEYRRLLRVDEKLKCRRADLMALQEGILANDYVAGFRIGRSKEKEELSKQWVSDDFGKKLRQGIAYSRILADLECEIFRVWHRNKSGENLGDPEMVRIGDMRNARLYISRQWQLADNFSEILFEVVRFDPKQLAISLAGNYLDILASLEKADWVIASSQPSSGLNPSHRAIIAAIVLWIGEKRVSIASITPLDHVLVSDYFSERSQALHPLSEIGRAPAGYRTLMNLKPSTLCANDTEFFAQFERYEANSLSYDAAWTVATLLLPLEISFREYYSMTKAIHVGNQIDKSDEFFIKLGGGDWILAKLGPDSADKSSLRVAAKDVGKARVAPQYRFWKDIRTLSESSKQIFEYVFEEVFVCSDPRIPKNCPGGIKQSSIRQISAGNLDKAKHASIADYLSLEMTRVIKDRVPQYKTKLYRPGFGQRLLFDLVPFYKLGYLISFDKDYQVSPLDVLVDTFTVILSLYPASKGIGAVISRSTLRESVRSGRALGLSGSALATHVLRVIGVSKVGADVSKVARIIAAALLDILVPLPIDIADIGRASKAAVIRPARLKAELYLPNDWNVRGIRIDNQYLRPVAARPSLEFNVSSHTYTLREALPVPKYTEYVRAGEKFCEVRFNWRTNTYNAVHPVSRLDGPSLRYFDGEWKVVPEPTPPCTSMRRFAITHIDEGLSLQTAKEMRDVLARAKHEALSLLEEASFALRESREGLRIARLFEIFFGESGDDVLDHFLDTRLPLCGASLAKLNVSTTTRYAKQGHQRDVLITTYPSNAPPLYQPHEDYYPLKMTSKDVTFLLTAFEKGLDEVAIMGSQFDQVMSRMLIHESYHMSAEDLLDVYAARTGTRNSVERLVVNSGEKLRGIPVEDLATDPKFKNVVLQTLRFAIEKDPTRRKWRLRNRVPGTDQPLGPQALEALYTDKSKVKQQLQDVVGTYAPKMQFNPDSVSFVVLGLAYLKNDPESLRYFFTSYEKFMNGELDSLAWDYRALY